MPAIKPGDRIDTLHTLIEERAYALWESEGRPHGRHLDHWQQAETEILASQEGEGGLSRPLAAASASPRKKELAD